MNMLINHFIITSRAYSQQLYEYFILWRDTTSEPMAPGPSFSIDYNNTVYLLLIFTCSLIRFHAFIHYTIHLIALFSADRED